MPYNLILGARDRPRSIRGLYLIHDSSPRSVVAWEPDDALGVLQLRCDDLRSTLDCPPFKEVGRDLVRT